MTKLNDALEASSIAETARLNAEVECDRLRRALISQTRIVHEMTHYPPARVEWTDCEQAACLFARATLAHTEPTKAKVKVKRAPKDIDWTGKIHG